MSASMLLACIGLVACGDERAATGSDVDRVEIVPFKSTLVLTEADLAGVAVHDTEASLDFPAAAPVLASLQPGRILVAGKTQDTPHGLLRAVKSVQADGERVHVETRHVPLQLAFRKVHMADLWSMKVRARDGQIEFAPDKAVATPIDTEELPCTLTSVPWSPTIEPAPLFATTDAVLNAQSWNAQVQIQTP